MCRCGERALGCLGRQWRYPANTTQWLICTRPVVQLEPPTSSYFGIVGAIAWLPPLGVRDGLHGELLLTRVPGGGKELSSSAATPLELRFLVVRHHVHHDTEAFATLRASLCVHMRIVGRSWCIRHIPMSESCRIVSTSSTSNGSSELVVQGRWCLAGRAMGRRSAVRMHC